MDGSPWGGSEELWFQAARLLVKRKQPVAVAVLKWPKPATQLGVLRTEGVSISEYGVPSAPMRVLHRLAPSLRYRWLDRIDAQGALISSGSNWSVRTAEVAEEFQRRHIPYILLAQSAFPWYWPPDSLAERMRSAYNNAAASFFVSHANWRVTQQQLGDPISNGVVVRNGFNVDYEQPLPWPEGEPLRLACVARLEPGIKGHDVLFEALADKVWSERPIAVTLYGHGHQAALTRSLIDRYALQDKVQMGGFMEPREIWRGNHALVLTSRAEGLPIVLIEAMLAGRPSIVTDVGGNAEAVEDGKSGFVAEAPTVASVRATLERAWQRRHDWQQMGECAAQRARAIVPPDPVNEFLKAVDTALAV